MKNFLLVYPTLISEAPMTLAMLAGVLKQEGFKVHTCVNTFKKPLSVDDIVNRAKEINPEYVGISMLTFDVLNTYHLVARLKASGFKVILGGPHPTDCPAEGIEAGADIVVCGEGETALGKIVRGEIISGVVPKFPRLEVRELPPPDLTVFNTEDFIDKEGFVKGFHRIYTSRGCPGVCTFCDWKVFGQKYKEYNIVDIVNDIKTRIEKYGIRSFSIADDCFTADKERVFEFCRLVKPLGISWRANSRANFASIEMFEMMKACGCHSVAFGFESGDNETLLRIGKQVTANENIKAARWAHLAGLEVYGCMMTGFPWETTKHVYNQIEFVHTVWKEVSLFQVSGSLMPFPGTAIYRQYAKQFGFEKYWLKPKYQGCGIQVYQNSPNPFAISNFYERHLFDDTYIREDYFFKYSPEYKKAVKELVWEIGKHNLAFMFRGRKFHEKLNLALAKGSMALADIFPNLEKKIGGALFSGRSEIEQLRDKRRGIAKRYTNPN